MLECRACLQRCLRAIAGDALRPSAQLRRQHQPLRPLLLSHGTFRRNATTALVEKQTSGNGVAGHQSMENGDEETEKSNSRGQSSMTPTMKRHLMLELRHLPDRVKVAEHVHYTLRCNQPEKALNLCRLASKDQEVIVAWNHCVDWHMRHNKIDEAIKIYNEMKKRAQFPDSYTYILLLRGLARGHHHGQVVKESNVAKALNIYNSLSSPTSRIKPSIMHTNAVLQVCNAALDMDALWGVVSKLPTSGANAPDSTTYSTILTAIRYAARGRVAVSMSEEQLRQRRDQAIQEGRGVWRDVMVRWRGGEVRVDEQLVVAAGRLLLMSRRMEDWDDVLNLVQQTMKIERLIPPLGDPNRHAEHVPQDTGLTLAESEAVEDSEGYSDAPATKAFQPFHPHRPDPAHPKRPTTLAWVQPSSYTLSLLTEACTVLRIPKTATAYWDLLTTEYSVKPDLENFHSLLKLMYPNRRSAQAAALLKDGMAAAGVEPKNQTFRLAMSVCMRDKNNRHVLSHARTIVDVMEQTQPDLDTHVLMQYLNLSLLADDGVRIAATLDRLDPIVQNLCSQMNYGSHDANEQSRTPAEHVIDREETVKFFQAMVGAIDTLMNRGLVPREDYSHWHARRSYLTRVIGVASQSIENQRTQLDMENADRRNRKEANEAGRRQRKQIYEERGRVGARMSKEEWALKVFRWKGRRDEAREMTRVKSEGSRRWDIGQAKPRGDTAAGWNQVNRNQS